ncbi:hypothetical protein DFH11DRAFT_889951 [Phellopilus nigrolimitatus]|nr:hypothetical protein DFH11DRAFT_889951 [Phellopilus nigrolimitatus]
MLQWPADVVRGRRRGGSLAIRHRSLSPSTSASEPEDEATETWTGDICEFVVRIFVDLVLIIFNLYISTSDIDTVEDSCIYSTEYTRLSLRTHWVSHACQIFRRYLAPEYFSCAQQLSIHSGPQLYASGTVCPRSILLLTHSRDARRVLDLFDDNQHSDNLGDSDWCLLVDSSSCKVRGACDFIIFICRHLILLCSSCTFLSTRISSPSLGSRSCNQD